MEKERERTMAVSTIMFMSDQKEALVCAHEEPNKNKVKSRIINVELRNGALAC